MFQDSTVVAAAASASVIVNNLGTAVLAAGALGTAAFGIVEASKYFRFIGEAGFGAALKIFGALTQPLAVAYGPEYEALLRGQYRGDQRDLVRLLRQGMRVGLNAQNAPAVAQFLGSIDGSALGAAVTKAQQGGTLTDAERSVIGRFELAADARVDAALAVAQADYTGAVRLFASVVAVAIAVVVGGIMDVNWFESALVGVAAVPLAPIAKDVASGIQAAAKVMKARG